MSAPPPMLRGSSFRRTRDLRRSGTKRSVLADFYVGAHAAVAKLIADRILPKPVDVNALLCELKTYSRLRTDPSEAGTRVCAEHATAFPSNGDGAERSDTVCALNVLAT
jgi:hypothetical protein